MKKIIRFFLYNRVLTAILLIFIIAGGIYTAPFNWNTGFFPRNTVPVDAIPDIGDNQQIVSCEWMGRSPKDIQEQITYPLTTQLLGISGVKTIRSTSMFGMSFIYIIFDDNVDFYFSRSRIIEKLASLPEGLLPSDVKPTLGPDATALGQIFWYTLEGRDPKTNKPTGGWSQEELRTIQDYYVKYTLSSAEGVSEVASVGGMVKEYQVDIDPQKMLAYNIDIIQVMTAVKNANIDVGAGTTEINRVEYMIRGLGYIKSIEDLENTVITSREGVPIRIKDIAKVNIGPAEKRGGLDKEGIEATGGVVVARYGSNPMEVINNVKAKIEQSGAGMPQKTLKNGQISKVTIVPFYDRTQLIKETIGTLEDSLLHEIIICIIVVLILILNLRASLVIATLVPLAVLSTFIIMKITGLQANIVALSGIAIAIGVMVDVGVVFTENVVRNVEQIRERGRRQLLNIINSSIDEVAPAVTTGMATTIISFLPVFVMQASEGKMFRPLAFTKTFALLSAFLLGIAVLPTLIYWIFSLFPRTTSKSFIYTNKTQKIKFLQKYRKYLLSFAVILICVYILTSHWMPLSVDKGILRNIVFVIGSILSILGILWLLVRFYEKILRWCLNNKFKFLLIPCISIIAGVIIWKNLGSEFMPSLDEGSFLLMPTAMSHTGVEQVQDYISTMDKRIRQIPEVESVVGKWGRVSSALDPAPVQMFETIINYKSEYLLDENGKRVRNNGKYVRQWREHIKSTQDIWDEISKAATIAGVTTAPKLQPISARLVMLTTGIRAEMGMKIYGNSLEDIEKAGLMFEKSLKEVEELNSQSVFFDRNLSSAYLEITLDREKMARYGISTQTLQDVISASIGNMPMTQIVNGKERYNIRVRYPKGLREGIQSMENILVPTENMGQIPLSSVANIDFEKSASMIQSEDAFLCGYIIFDKKENVSQTQAVLKAKQYIENKIKNNQIILQQGVSFQFAGNYIQQQRANNQLLLIIPIALCLILLILYLQFRSLVASLIHFSGVFVAFAGGFIMLWLYGQDWFLNFSFLGANLRQDVFNMQTVNISVAVWVGFIALFGIATDDGVLMGTIIHKQFLKDRPKTKQEIKECVINAGKKRVRPAAMTTATTLIALLPILSSVGKGADIMIPMSIPCFGGMVLQTITMFVVPVLQYCWRTRVETAKK